MRRILIVVLVLVVGGIGLAFYQDWFHLTVNKGKMEADTEGVKEKVLGLGKPNQAKAEGAADQTRDKPQVKGAGMKNVTGRVDKVESADHRFSITTPDKKEVTMHTDRASKLWRNDREVDMERLQVGDEVDVAYDLKDGMNLVTTVSANRNEVPKQ